MFLLKPILAFRPSKSDWIFAVKTFMAGILALYVSFKLNLHYPIWAIGTVFVIANPFTGLTLSKSVFRVLGTMMGALVALFATPILLHYPLLFTLFLASWVALCLYISLLDRTPRSYAFLLAGYTTVIVCYNSVHFIDTVSIFDMALGRFLEITVGVVCSGLVSALIFPQSIGRVIQSRIKSTLKDSESTFIRIIQRAEEAEPKKALSKITRDIADLHVLAIHLNYENSTLSGLTKTLHEMMHQLSILVSNLVAMSERIKQLNETEDAQVFLTAVEAQIQLAITQGLEHSSLITNELPDGLKGLFQQAIHTANSQQKVILMSLQMDIRHALQNVQSLRMIWAYIQQENNQSSHSNKSVRKFEVKRKLKGQYPKLHRDHGVAVRGGISGFLIIFISTMFWVLSGWNAGFMMAEMAAISACILTAMDNPVPALRMFIRGNIYAGVIVFIYAFGIFPVVTEFWQLVLVLAPFCIYCLMLFPHPPLTGIALPLIMGVMMGLNFQNIFHLDPILFFDATLGTILGPIISVYIIHIVRAISPDMSIQRILSLHYRALKEALYLPYGEQFQRHLRLMFDQIGVLNTKMTKSVGLQNKIYLVLIEASAAVDLSRLNELIEQQSRFKQNNERMASPQLLRDLKIFQTGLDQYLSQKVLDKNTEDEQLKILKMIEKIFLQIHEGARSEWSERLAMALNNIRCSLFHTSAITSLSQGDKVYG